MGGAKGTHRLPWEGSCRLEGAGEAGKRLLAFSGLSVSAYPWAQAVAALSSSGIGAVAVSLAGNAGCECEYRSCGAEEWLEAGEGELDASVEAAGGEPVILAGFSAGALVAAVLAARHPDKVRALFMVGCCAKMRKLNQRALLRLCGFFHRFQRMRGKLQTFSIGGAGSTAADLITDSYLMQPRFDFYPLSVLGSLARMQARAERALCKVRCKMKFFHAARDERTDISVVRAIARRLELRAGRDVEVIEYANSPHTLLLGPEGPQFALDFADAASSLWKC